jgi:putative cardiolipin synthase
MHNKLLVSDNAAALIGGRNIGNQYFQIDPESQFADDDVFTVGPIVGELSGTFDEFWNSDMAIPAKALGRKSPPRTAVLSPTEHERASGPSGERPPQVAPIDYASLLKTDQPYAGIVSGELPLVWAHARVVYDSPDKKQVISGKLPGHLIASAVLDSIREVQSEFQLVTPYFIPAPDELQVLKDLRQRQARVRILTNSLESAPEASAQAGYDHYRVPLLEAGVELHEVRALLGSVRGSGETKKISRYGHYALHGKMFVFDRQKLFIGSMNYDQRSKHINTEIGLIIDSSELAQETARRFDAMVKPEECYIVGLIETPGKSPRLVWRTEVAGRMVEHTREPARSGWQRLKVKLLALLPLDREL